MTSTRSAVWVAAVLVATAATAQASGLSERLTSRGLAEFHDARYEAALRQFDAAVDADAGDAQALYYRGVTRGHLGDYAGAAGDLAKAVAIAPDLEQAYLELGYARVRGGHEAEAIEPLTHAATFDTLAPQANLLLGIAQLRLGHYDLARGRLASARRLSPDLAVQAGYYQGIADYRTGRIDSARSRFERVIQTAPNSDEASEARIFLDRLQREQPKHWRIWGTLAWQYDSNVTLQPDGFTANNPEIAVSGKSDARVAVDVGGEFVPVDTSETRMAVSYDVSQSAHFELSDFDLQDHRVTGQVARYGDHLHYGMVGRYDYYFRDGDSFLSEVTALPWFRLPFGRLGSTEIYYRFKVRDFLGQPFDLLRDSENNAVGIRHRIDRRYHGRDYYFSAGYRFDRDKADHPEGKQFQYDGHLAEVSAGVRWTPTVTVDAGYAYKREIYDAASMGRRDNEHHFLFEARKELTDWAAVTATYIGRLNDSNDPDYHYDRHIASVALELRY